MTGVDIQAAYFSPFHFLIYLTIIFGAMVVYYQWQWGKRCNNEVKVLLVQPDGSTNTEYAPKTGSYVALKVADSNSTRLWPINKLTTIELMYPGDGFIPNFLQKKIKTVILDAEDWEPMINRGSYTRMVASPDVVRAIRDIATDYPDASDELNDLADGLATAPTRELVASPIILGNIMKEKVAELAVTVSKESLDNLSGIARKLERLPNATVTYVALGIVAVLVVVSLVLGVTGSGGLSFDQIVSDLAAIKRALGIP